MFAFNKVNSPKSYLVLPILLVMVADFWCPAAGFLQRSDEWNNRPWVQHQRLVPGGLVGGTMAAALTANWLKAA